MIRLKAATDAWEGSTVLAADSLVASTGTNAAFLP
jgi:hypothetical protein